MLGIFEKTFPLFKITLPLHGFNKKFYPELMVSEKTNRKVLSCFVGDLQKNITYLHKIYHGHLMIYV